MTARELSDLLVRADLLRDAPSAPFTFTSLGCDSRSVQPGQLFFCKGVRFSPPYLEQAKNAGASAYVSETRYESSLPCVLVSDIRKAMPTVAHAFYGAPETRFPLVGITGTKGKTSVAYQLAACLNEFQKDCYGLISTNEGLCCGKTIEKSGTTPEALDTYRILNTFAEEGVKAGVMEVSSQGLKYDRVAGLTFAVGIFLNLSPDHISPTEHSDFEDYKAAKKKLLQQCEHGIVNADDPYAAEFIAASTCKTVTTVSLKDTSADFFADNVRLFPTHSEFLLIERGLPPLPLRLNMSGEYNVSNALCAYAAGRRLGLSPETLKAGLEKATVPGRMELFELDGVHVLVDYAHNGLSFERVFDFADTVFPNARKIALYGCPGNKALDRRYEMSDVAGRRADYTVLTDDDPEEEIPAEIRRQAAQRLLELSARYEEASPRSAAIRRAWELARPGDLLLLLGKGHETTQKVRRSTEFYGGDRAVIYQAAALAPKTEHVQK